MISTADVPPVLYSASNTLLRSMCMTSSSYQFLPLFTVFNSYSFECHRLSFHQVAQQVQSLPTSCSLPTHSSNICKKLQFMHTVNGDGSKTANIIKT